MSIFDRVKKLNFPIGEYVVVGGAMEAYGLRTAHDVDIVVTEKLYSELKQQGWKMCDCEQCTLSGRVLLKADGVDILPDYSWGEKYHADTAELIKNADIIEGVPFVRLEELLKWKKAASRPKDQADIIIIEGFLAKKQIS